MTVVLVVVGLLYTASRFNTVCIGCKNLKTTYTVETGSIPVDTVASSVISLCICEGNGATDNGD